MPRTDVHLKGLRPLARPARARAQDAGARNARNSSTQHIVDGITAAIVERRLVPGTKLAEQHVADIFQVSRTLVRQALNRLSRDHLVTLEPARGAFVARPSNEEARQVFEARLIIESAIVTQLCTSITEAGVARLRRHLQDEAAAVGAADDVPRRTRLLAGFHVLLAQLLGNAVLADLLSDLLHRSALAALVHQSDGSAAGSQSDHGAIVDAIAQRDAGTATRLLQAHLASVERDLQAPGAAGAAVAPAEPARPARPARRTRPTTPSPA